MASEEIIFKSVFLGDTLVGKTCITNRITKGIFIDTPTTIGSSFIKHSKTLDGHKVSAHIWDTAGQERYANLVSLYYKRSKVATIVYDVTNYNSFKRAEFWIRELNDNVDDCDIILVGNKTDLLEGDDPTPAFVSEVNELATSHNCTTIYVSAKTGRGIDNLVNLMFETYLKHDHKDLLPFLTTANQQDQIIIQDPRPSATDHRHSKFDNNERHHGNKKSRKVKLEDIDDKPKPGIRCSLI